jgi:hypothetical protein
MLDSQTVKKIEDLVYTKPRSIQEIAQCINMNWRTADRYVEEIEKNFGTLNTRTFRGGTRGALKIVYWASVEKVSYSIFQERLEKEILRARRKEDFSAFDIFQHVPDKNKRAFVEKAADENSMNYRDVSELLKKAEKQLIILSGNLSFLNIKNKTIDFYSILEDLVKRKVTIKIICRVDIVGRENIKKVLSLNFKYGRECIEIRHREQPLRAFIIDNKLFEMKEVKEPTGKIHELDKKILVYYTLKDKEWIEWITHIFWKMFSESVGAEKRLEEMNKIIS